MHVQSIAAYAHRLLVQQQQGQIHIQLALWPLFLLSPLSENLVLLGQLCFLLIPLSVMIILVLTNYVAFE